MAETLLSNAGGMGSILGWGAKMPYGQNPKI